MADLTPTTDTKGPPKKTIIILGVAGGAFLLYFLYKKRKESESAPTQQNPYLAQSFIPVTAENVGGVGAGGGGTIGGGIGNTEGNNTTLLQSQKEYSEFITNLLKSEREGREGSERSRREEQKELITAFTGGGPPNQGQGTTGSGSGGGGEGHTKTEQPKPETGHPTPKEQTPKCPTGWKWNPAKGTPSPHSCYHISREKCGPGNKCPVHGYQDGTEVCVC